MNILFLSAHLPSPVGRQAGQKTSYQICNWLARHHSVHLLGFATTAELRNSRREDNQIFDGLETIEVDTWTRVGGIVRKWHYPLTIAARSSSLFHGKLRSLLKTHRFEVAILDHTAMFQYAGELSSVQVLVGSAHDVVSQLWQRKSRLQPSFFLRTLYRFEYSRVQKWERLALGNLDVIAPHSDKDARLLQQISTSARICPIRPWFTLPQCALSIPRIPGSIAFLGAFDRSENRDALEYGIREVLPLIRREYPDFKFYIVGSHSERMKSLAKEASDIVVCGFVEDLAGFLSSMQLALLPLRFGAGIKVKMLECMASGLAVVTTEVGAEGVGGESGVQYFVGNSAQELADRTIQLLRNPTLAWSMGESARNLVLEEFNFGEALERLWSLVDNYFVESTPAVHA